MGKRGPKPKDWQCAVDGCTSNRPSHGGRLCSTHRARRKRNGDVLAHIPVTHGYAKGPKARCWKGGESKLKNGRVLIYAPDHPRASSCGLYVFRYVLVMEKYLNRFLLDDECIHHINGDWTDDRLENLQIVSRAEHSRFHFKGKNHADRKIRRTGRIA
jgi:hypothetical protein